MPNYTSLMKHRELMERKALYEAWERSGLTKIEFCKQNNIAKRSFYKWIKQLQNDNYLNNDGILNNITDIDDGNLETDPIKFLKLSEAYHISSQKSFSLESSPSGALEISLPNGTVVKATVSQNHINNFLQEIIRNGNKSAI